MARKPQTSGRKGRPLARILRAVAGIALGLASVASLLPLLETNMWWVRYLDFARLQLLLVVLVTIVLLVPFGGWRRWWSAGLIALGVVASGYHAYRMYPYGPIVTPMAVAVRDCPAGARLDMMVANVQQSNQQADRFFDVVDAAEPDVLVILETDPWWDEALQRLGDRFPHSEQFVPASGGENSGAFGMHLLSRLPLSGAETLFYFDADTPTIVADAKLPGGAQVQIVASHPRPPLYWSQPTTTRDAHLLTAALEARASELPSVLAGDLNAVPWERTTRRAMRLGELLDPRVGRGVYPTYDAQSWLMSWPLDQILFQDRIGLAEWRVLPSFGSDHLPVFAGLCLLPELADRQAPPALEAGDIEEAETSIKAAKEG